MRHHAAGAKPNTFLRPELMGEWGTSSSLAASWAQTFLTLAEFAGVVTDLGLPL